MSGKRFLEATKNFARRRDEKGFNEVKNELEEKIGKDPLNHVKDILLNKKKGGNGFRAENKKTRKSSKKSGKKLQKKLYSKKFNKRKIFF